MALFQSSVLKKYLSTQTHQPMHEAFAAYQSYFHNPHIRVNILAAKEEQFQEGFLRELFVKIFGYTINPEPYYNLTTELKNVKDAKKTDGAILKDGNAIAVIELKGADTKDLEKIRDQAFNYKNNQPECVYVITSNFEKLRFYIDNAVDFVEFNILAMDWEQFKLMWLLLHRDNLLSGIPKKIKDESLVAEEQITKQLYRDYSTFKQELWQNLCAQNPGEDELLLYKKSQKLLDRFLFIFFAEDKGLLPPNSISEILKHWSTLEHLDAYSPLYDRFKLYFGFLNTGRPAKKDKVEIHAYNGGLFAPDSVLDTLTISDEVLETHTRRLTEYDFESEVDTNILGHIFEHSLNDIENVRAQIAGELVDKSKTKRKRDGVFYTPKYITKYIVDNTLGRLCTEKKAELALIDEEFSKYHGFKTAAAERKRKADLKLKLDTYRTWLLALTICDPACGSGAFLNQVLEFLMAEHRYVDELESQLFDSPLVLPNVENHILENNIFGVDINEESVEIARLSLWLRTAKRGRKLSSLNSNIKVGNSLIDDPEVAGDLAFDWEKEFPKVFAKGGFDVVVGNPPYGANISENQVGFLKSNYTTASYQIDTYPLFCELSLKLSKEFTKISLIIPSAWTIAGYGKELRELLIEKAYLEQIVIADKKTFFDATVETVILTFSKNLERKPIEIVRWDLPNSINYFIDTEIIRKSDSNEIPIYQNAIASNIISKMKVSGKKLGDYLDFVWGVKVYQKGKGTPKQDGSESVIKKFHLPERKFSNHLQLLGGKNIFRYQLIPNKEYLDYGKWLAEPRSEEWFISDEPRILIREVTSNGKIQATIVKQPFVFTNSIDGARLNDKSYPIEFYLAILNSKIISYYHINASANSFKDAFPKVLIQDLKGFPMPKMDFSKITAEGISKYVKKLIVLNEEVNLIKQNFYSHFIVKLFEGNQASNSLVNWPSLDFKGFLGELSKAKVKLSLFEEAEWMGYFNEQKAKALALQADITRLDRDIDVLVYELYGLTEEEIRIVEGN